jgi:hypothetical protein
MKKEVKSGSEFSRFEDKRIKMTHEERSMMSFKIDIKKSEAKNICNVLPKERIHFSLQHAKFVKNFTGNPMDEDDEGGMTIIATDGRSATFFRELAIDPDDPDNQAIPDEYIVEGETLEAASKVGTKKFPASIIGNEKFQYVRTNDGKEIKIPKSDGISYPDVKKVVPKRPDNCIKLGINPRHLLRAAMVADEDCQDLSGIEIVIDLSDVIKEIEKKYTEEGSFDAIKGIETRPEGAVIVNGTSYRKSWALVMPCVRR